MPDCSCRGAKHDKIRKSIAGQNVTLNSDASDVNCDGKLTAADVLMIRKFIAGQNIELGK